jgi:hypothetical protein
MPAPSRSKTTAGERAGVDDRRDGDEALYRGIMLDPAAFGGPGEGRLISVGR